MNAFHLQMSDLGSNSRPCRLAGLIPKGCSTHASAQHRLFSLEVTVCILGNRFLCWHMLRLSQPSTDRLQDVQGRMQGPHQALEVLAIPENRPSNMWSSRGLRREQARTLHVDDPDGPPSRQRLGVQHLIQVVLQPRQGGLRAQVT